MSKLIFLVFALLVARGGAVMDELQECLDMIDTDQLERLTEMENIDELGMACSTFLPFFECVENVVKRATGMTIGQLVLFIDDEQVSRAVSLFSNVKDLTTDLCDEDSDLHKAYVESSECYNSLELKDKKCKADGEAAYEAYREFSENLHEDERSPASSTERNCMVISYMVACMSADIKETCGEAAHNTFLQILRRSTALKYGACSPDDATTLKTQFLDFLEEESSRKEVFSQVFDFRRKK